MEIFLAIFLGLLFGFILQKSGAANPNKIIGMLRLTDLHLMKTILLGIGLSSFGLFALLGTGVVDVGHISIKSSNLGVIVGGAILGLGWAVSGYCPGTGLVAAGAGRKDAIFFVLGGLTGAFLYFFLYAPLQATFLVKNFGGKVTLAATGNDNFSALLPGIPAVIVAGVTAIIFMTIAWILPLKNKT